jgi:hypothetical protein
MVQKYRWLGQRLLGLGYRECSSTRHTPSVLNVAAGSDGAADEPASDTNGTQACRQQITTKPSALEEAAVGPAAKPAAMPAPSNVTGRSREPGPPRSLLG